MKKVFKSKILWFFIIVIIIIIAFIFRSVTAEPNIEYVTQKAEIGDIIQTVSATGQVKSASEIQLNFKNTGTLSVLNVDTGDEVIEGDIIAQLKATDLGIAITQAQADLQEAQANLNKVAAGSTAEEIAVAQAAVEKSKTDLANAQADKINIEKTYHQALKNSRADLLNNINAALTKADITIQKVYDILYFEGDENNFITTKPTLERSVHSQYDNLEVEIIKTKSDYNTAKSNLSDTNINQAASTMLNSLDLIKNMLRDLAVLLDDVTLTQALTQTDLDTIKTTTNTERTTTDTNINSVSSANQDFHDAQINYDTKIEDAANAILVAQKNLTKAEVDLDLKQAAARPEDIALYQARVRRAQANLSLAQDRYEDTILRTPISGVITEVNVNLGEQTSLNEPVVKMLATENYEIEVDIPESDIAKIETADQAEITLDAFSDEDVFNGTITTINPAQTEIQDVVYYKVTVSFTKNQPARVVDLLDKVKPGMTADVIVMTDKKEKVLTIPSRAIKEKNGDKIVEILQNNQPVEIIVTLGLRGDEGLIEITSGLSAGQEVITFVRNN